MTRDELIAADPPAHRRGRPAPRRSRRCASLQIWLQRSDDLLATAWGSMDRYHLAWLMVGKPKGIVRGRPMTADEEAAYVREVAEQKTAALRMSLDAVERQGMPFVGETGGRGRARAIGRNGSASTGEGRAARIVRRTGPACRRTRPSPSGWPRRAARPTRISTTTRRARRAPRRCSGDRARAGPGGRRHAGRSRRPIRSPATTSSSRSASTSTSRGSSTATSARPTSRRRWTWRSSARRPACAPTRPPCATACRPR